MTDVKVPFIDPKPRFQEEREELLACVERVLPKGRLVPTPEVNLREGIRDMIGWGRRYLDQLPEPAGFVLRA